MPENDNDKELGEYTVEIAVHGTWRDSVVAYDNAEAENLVESMVERKVASRDGWGDLGFEVVGSRKID